MDSYSNLSGLIDGRVSGNLDEWPALKQEAKSALREIMKLESMVSGLSAAQHLNAVQIFEMGPLQAALHRIDELEAELSDWQRYCGIILREKSQNMNIKDNA